MADEISIESLEKILELTKDPALKVFIDTLKGAGQAVTSLGEIIGKVSPETQEHLKKIGEVATAAFKSFGGFTEVAEKVQAAGEDLWKGLTGGVNSYVNKQLEAGRGIEFLAAKTALFVEPMIGFIPQGITGMGEFGKAGYDAGQSIADSFGKVEPALKTIFGNDSNAVATMKRMNEGASQAYAFQKGLIDLAAAQGHLSSMTNETGDSFSNLQNAMAQMTDLAYTTARNTGQSIESIMGLSQAMRGIPGAFAEPISVGGVFTNQLQLTSQVATAFGQKQSEVAKQLSELYTATGIKGQESFEAIARLYDAAGDSKLRFEGFNKSVMEIAGSFKMLGDNTNSAISVVKAFDTAFKDSNISPAAMTQVISSLTTGISSMERGTQAFISAQSGGPGGLAGAFEIELAMQEGDMASVLEKTMVAMQSQFGGEVLTLKDAASNPALAGEFYKQVQYLTQVAGVAKDDREAYRILEAMKSGVTDMLQPGAPAMEGKDALAQAQARGFDEQKRTTSIMTRIQQEMERFTLVQSQQLGIASTGVLETVGIHNIMKRISGTGPRVAALAESGSNIGTKTPEDNIDALAKSTTDVVSGMMSSLRGLGTTEPGRAFDMGEFMETASVDKERSEARRLAGTAVGEGFAAPPPPGTRAGLSNIAGAELPTRAPAVLAGPGAMNPAQYFAEKGEWPEMPVEVTHSPIKVELDFGDMFDKKVIEIASEVYDRRKGGEVTQGGLGR